MTKPYSFCHYCGEEMSSATETPDGPQCINCGQTTWMNVVGVSVLIAPYRDPESSKQGVFIQKRGIQPALGEWALPSGYIMKGESWEAAACREANEEIGLVCRHTVPFEKPKHLLTENSSENTMVIIVGFVEGIFQIKPFVPHPEVLERGILFPDDERQLCFPIHRQALAMYWDKLGIKHSVQL